MANKPGSTRFQDRARANLLRNAGRMRSFRNLGVRTLQQLAKAGESTTSTRTGQGRRVAAKAVRELKRRGKA